MTFPKDISLGWRIGFMALVALTAVASGCESVNDFDSFYSERVIGEVEVLAASYEDRDEIMYFLVTDDEQRTRLHFIKDPELMTGDKIEVFGTRNQEEELLVENFVILVMQPRSLEVPGELRPAMEHKVAVLRLRGTSITEEQARSTIGAVDAFYRENSHEIDTFSGKIFGPYRVNTANCNTRFGQIRDDALAAFRAAGHNPDSYTNIAFVIPKDSGCGWGGLGQVGRPGKPAKFTWYNNWFDCRPVAHELGHNLGWAHSRSMRCPGGIYKESASGCSLSEYGHPFDNMGNGACNVHYSAPQKQYMGWLERCEDVTAGSSAVFNLSPLEGNCGIRSLRIPIPGENSYYYVEYRQKDSGKYAGAEGKDAVLVSLSNDAMTTRAQMSLLDFTPATATFKDAWLSVGTSYALPGGINIKLLSQGEIAKVRVTMGKSGDHLCAGGKKPTVAPDGSVGGLCDAGGGSEDLCPNDPDKTEPGICGCGVPEGTCGTGSAGLQNIALNKPTSQSSTANGGLSSRAVDGNTSGLYIDASVTHTNNEAAPWWRVNLGSAYSVSRVVLFNRTDNCCKDRLANFNVDYLDRRGNVIATQLYSGVAPAKTTITLAAQGVRAVRVRLNGTNSLSLAEVRVWGEP